MTELNPNHPVTSAMHDQWHKVVAALMVKYHMDVAVIDVEDLLRLQRSSKRHVVIEGKGEALQLRLVTEQEAVRLARQAGGLHQ